MSEAQMSVHTEFILLVSGEANEICEKSSKKTILPEHVVAALKVSQACTTVQLSLIQSVLSHWALIRTSSK
jgi:hypothetical protein